MGTPTPQDRYDARLRLACLAGRAVSSLSRASGRGGGVIGGRVTMKLAPDAPRTLAAGRDVTLISGTNGKTTTSAFLTAAMRTMGDVAANADGANIPAGFTTTLANDRSDRAVLETDEGWVRWAVQQLAPARVLLLNLSRDQLSRHHEVGRLMNAWREAMAGVDTVIANADDPDIVWPALAARRQVWVAAGQRWTDDSMTCPACGGEYHRDDDGWRCDCGFARPTPDWWVEGDELVSASVRLPLELSVPGVFNKSNAAMAVAAATGAGADPEAALAAMREIGSVKGRYSWHDVGEHRVRLLLAKNPAGWLDIIDLVQDTGNPLVLAFNSEGVDGRDPSWLYDVPFDMLAGRDIAVIGKRATDMRVRLEMAGITPRVVDGGLRAALTALPPGRVDVLANYTAFQQARGELAHVRH